MLISHIFRLVTLNLVPCNCYKNTSVNMNDYIWNDFYYPWLIFISWVRWSFLQCSLFLWWFRWLWLRRGSVCTLKTERTTRYGKCQIVHYKIKNSHTLFADSNARTSWQSMISSTAERSCPVEVTIQNHFVQPNINSTTWKYDSVSFH